MNNEKNMNWGNYIVISFVIFIGLVASMVVVSMKQDIPLVSRDYYEKEIKYQDEIDALNNAKGLEKQVATKVENRNLSIVFDGIGVKTGRLEIYSPLGPKNDRMANFIGQKVDFDLKDVKAGNYKLKVFWTDHSGKNYQINRSLYIP